MEKKGVIPPEMGASSLLSDLDKLGQVLMKIADLDISVWLELQKTPTRTQVHRASTIIADRLCGSVANPIIRNAQEKRQLDAISSWLLSKSYRHINGGESRERSFDMMSPGTFSFRTNVPVSLENGKVVNIPVDVVVMPLHAKKQQLPVFIEAKSAGDFTNVNKRRKEEAVKMAQLRKTYGKEVSFNLYLMRIF